MPSQAALSGWHLTVGITGVGAAAAAAAPKPTDPGARLPVVGPGIAWGRDNAVAAFRLAAARLDDEADAVEAVVNGPVNSEQPLAQPVAAGPTNVGAVWG
jgi:hypothetical protein